MPRKIVLGITGASGAIYARLLLRQLLQLREKGAVQEVGVTLSANARQVWQHELGGKEYESIPFTVYAPNDFNAPFASGSARFDTMIICPCSMGTLGRIASGVSDDLMTRAADVILKERRRLILAVRDTPYSLIHLRNMETVTLAGGIICPASPSFYSHPKDMEELAATVTNRVLDLAGLEAGGYRWGEK